MFCSKCGKQLQEGAQFCHNCGSEVNKIVTPQIANEVKVMLDPLEVVNYSGDYSRKTTSGHAGTYGFMLMIISIIFDLVGMIFIGTSFFVPMIIIGTSLFAIGFLIKMFCP